MIVASWCFARISGLLSRGPTGGNDGEQEEEEGLEKEEGEGEGGAVGVVVAACVVLVVVVVSVGICRRVRAVLEVREPLGERSLGRRLLPCPAITGLTAVAAAKRGTAAGRPSARPCPGPPSKRRTCCRRRTRSLRRSGLGGSTFHGWRTSMGVPPFTVVSA